jgi:cyclopropane fatty-acyl-phospholipid synthase-like methyltransferase
VTVVNFPYIDVEIDHLRQGGVPPEHLRHFHWGLFDDPEVVDDSIDRYHDAARRMTERVLVAAGVDDGGRVLDVGCGFGGTLDHIRGRNHGCRLVGLNIDVRQLRWGRHMLTTAGPRQASISFVAGDGCRLPVAAGSVDHVLAVECVFHFPSRKQFFREAARVLEPGGTLALSDFVIASGGMAAVGANVTALGLGDWFGRSAAPLTPEGYERLGRATGLDLVVDDDVTARTLPTYAALRRLYREQGFDDGAQTIGSIEQLAIAGGWQYHVMAFRRRGGGT